MFGSSVPNGVLTNFSGPIIKGMGFSELNAALLDCAGRSLQIISLLIAGIIATKFENCRIIMVTVGNLIWCACSHFPFPAWPRLTSRDLQRPRIVLDGVPPVPPDLATPHWILAHQLPIDRLHPRPRHDL